MKERRKEERRGGREEGNEGRVTNLMQFLLEFAVLHFIRAQRELQPLILINLLHTATV